MNQEDRAGFIFFCPPRTSLKLANAFSRPWKYFAGPRSNASLPGAGFWDLRMVLSHLGDQEGTIYSRILFGVVPGPDSSASLTASYSPSADEFHKPRTFDGLQLTISVRIIAVLTGYSGSQPHVALPTPHAPNLDGTLVLLTGSPGSHTNKQEECP